MNYPRKNLIYLKQVYNFQSNQIKFKNLESSLPFHCLFLKKPKSEETKSQIKAHLLYLANSYLTTTNLLQVYYINIVSYETLEKMNIYSITLFKK